MEKVIAEYAEIEYLKFTKDIQNYFQAWKKISKNAKIKQKFYLKCPNIYLNS